MIRIAQATAPTQPNVLILGNRTVANQLSSDFGRWNYKVFFERDFGEWPDVGQGDASSRLEERLRDFVNQTGQDAGGLVHPGVSPWGERPELFSIADRMGLTVVGPASRTVSAFSNKLTFLEKSEQLGVPNVVLQYEPIQSLREVEAILEKHPFPIVLKSVREGGAGFGIRVFHQFDELKRYLPLWIDQLRKTSGEAIFFAESYVDAARKIAVPFVRLQNGETHLFPMVDASLQSRHRKVIEFCPAFELDPEVQALLTRWSQIIVESCSYVGVGVLEYLVDGSRAFLVQGLPRLNASYHLWEEIAQTSAVDWQMKALFGRSAPRALPQGDSPSAGVALRLYAEDSLLQIPQPGRVHELTVPKQEDAVGASARMSLGVSAGDETLEEGEGLIGMVVTHARDRESCLEFAKSRIRSMWIAGSLQTNERFLFELADHPWVREGMFHAGFVDEEFIPQLAPHRQLLKAFAAICEKIDTESRSDPWLVGDKWIKPDASMESSMKALESFEVGEQKGLSGSLELSDQEVYRFCAYPISQGRWQVRVGSWCMIVKRLSPFVEKRSGDQISFRVYAQLTGRVHAVLYRQGAVAPAHEPLLIIESLRTLVPHALPTDVRVKNWNVKAEERVMAGQNLGSVERIDAKA